MKQIHLAGLFLAGLLILASIFILPKYNSLRLAEQNIAVGNLQLNNGDIIGGLSRIQNAINLTLSQGDFPQNVQDGIRSQLIKTAGAHPLKSNLIFDFLRSNKMPPTCSERLTVYRDLLDQAVQSSRTSANDEILECLYLAARWSAQCPVDDISLGKYRKVFNYYKYSTGVSFVHADWMDLAYEGKPILSVAAGGTQPAVKVAGGPIVKFKAGAASTQNAIINRITGYFNSLMQKIGLAEKPVTPTVTTPAEVTNRAATGTIAVPAPQPAKPEVTPTAQPTAPQAVQPVTPQATAPAGQTKINPPEIAPPKLTGTRQIAQIPKPPAPQAGFLQKIMSLPGLAVAKVKGLISSNPLTKSAAKKAPESGAGNSALANEIESATRNIREAMPVVGINAELLAFSPDGADFSISFVSQNVGTDKIKSELKAILTTVDDRVQKSGKIPLNRILIEIKDTGKVSQGKIAIGYKDYREFREGTMNGVEFRNRWKTF